MITFLSFKKTIHILIEIHQDRRLFSHFAAKPSGEAILPDSIPGKLDWGVVSVSTMVTTGLSKDSEKPPICSKEKQTQPLPRNTGNFAANFNQTGREYQCCGKENIGGRIFKVISPLPVSPECCYFLSSQLPSYDLFSMLRVVFAGNGSNRRARVTFTKYVCLLLLHSANHSFSDILIENECNMRPNFFYLEVFSLPKACLKSQKMWKN